MLLTKFCSFWAQHKFLKFFKINHQIWNVKQGTQTKAVICLITSKDNKKVILNDHAIYGGVIFNIDSTRIETKRRSEEFKILEFIIENLTKKFKKIDIQLSPELHDIRPFQWFNYHKKKWANRPFLAKYFIPSYYNWVINLYK